MKNNDHRNGGKSFRMHTLYLQTLGMTRTMVEGATMTAMIAGGATTPPKATTTVRTKALYLRRRNSARSL